jgi:hypothetical protein
MLGSCRPISETWFLQVRKMLSGTNSYSCFNYYYEIYFSLILSFWFNMLGHLPVLLCFDASRADFSQEPAFSWIRKLPADIRTAIHHSKILFCNGYAFDEFFPDVIASSIDCAICSGTAVFFDPGPRGKSLLHGNLDEQRALEHALRLSDVLLLTSDEVSWHTCCFYFTTLQ